MFAVTTAKGSAWNDARDILEQLEFDAHAQYMDELVERGVIVLGGPISSGDDADIALLPVDAESAEGVRRLFDDDPWILNEVFRLKSIHTWTIWLDGRRTTG